MRNRTVKERTFEEIHSKIDKTETERIIQRQEKELVKHKKEVKKIIQEKFNNDYKEFSKYISLQINQ